MTKNASSISDVIHTFVKSHREAVCGGCSYEPSCKHVSAVRQGNCNFWHFVLASLPN